MLLVSASTGVVRINYKLLLIDILYKLLKSYLKYIFANRFKNVLTVINDIVPKLLIVNFHTSGYFLAK